MAATDRQQCEFSLIRYVPDPVKNEFVNIGVLLRDRAEPGRTELRFTRDWKRVQCLHPMADIAMLEALEIELRQRLSDSNGLLALLRDTLSNTVQMTQPKGCLAETFKTQVEALMRMYVEAQKLPREQKRSGRSAILAEMRRYFEQEGVWEMMPKRLAASQYTRAGDPLHIDCGYRTNGTMKMFQAVSLGNDIDAAIALAFASKPLSAGVKEKSGAVLELTAIVEPIRELGEDREGMDQYEFGRDSMQAQDIRVLTISAMGGVAATARAELRVN